MDTKEKDDLKKALLLKRLKKRTDRLGRNIQVRVCCITDMGWGVDAAKPGTWAGVTKQKLSPVSRPRTTSPTKKKLAESTHRG